MSNHLYRITVEPVPGPGGEPTGEPLRFEAESHDDLFAIVEKLRARPDFDPDASPAFALGLKLLGSVLLARRGQEPYASMGTHFGEIMRLVKRGRSGDSA